MRALSIRQPYAELILRGIKKIEYRSRRTRIIGERFYIYASKGTGQLAIGAGAESALTPALSQREREQLPTGVIVGSATITRCNQASRLKPHAVPLYHWHLSDVKRLRRPRKPKRMPQPVWFTPF
ncbi:MAG: ASCH domain-containing protein [Planctomycetes bacterium]|nr:ASCH domain-containing protein [Planctomycetota bacterium]